MFETAEIPTATFELADGTTARYSTERTEYVGRRRAPEQPAEQPAERPAQPRFAGIETDEGVLRFEI